MNPEAAIISVGENGNGCPSIKVMSDVINSVNNNFHRTDEHGNVVIEVTTSGYTIN